MKTFGPPPRSLNSLRRGMAALASSSVWLAGLSLALVYGPSRVLAQATVPPMPNAPAPAPGAAAAQPATLPLTLREAIAMALQNNLDIQLERQSQAVADAGITRTEGGGAPIPVNLNVAEAPVGVPLASLPLLTSSTPAGVNPAALSVSSSFDAGHVLEANHSLSLAGNPFSPGSAIPAFDAGLQGQFGWIRRNPDTSIATANANDASNTAVTDNTLGNVVLTKGYSSGAFVQLGVNDFVQSFYSARSSAIPFSKPNAIALFAQPLLRGAGRANNTRFIAVAKTNKKISAIVLEQQMISTISGVAALYYDLISLQDAVAVQQEALGAAETLLGNDKQQLAVGRMPPIEVARAESLVSANRLALTQAISQRDQQQVILRTLLDPDSVIKPAQLPSITATDVLSAPGTPAPQPIATLIQTALAERPDLVQARLQIANGERLTASSANARLPELDLYASFQNRGVIAPSLLPIAGDPATGAATLDPIPAGGRSASRIYQAGIQFNLPVQNRLAAANFASDRIELGQERTRLRQMETEAAGEVRNAGIALAAAQQAALAATESRKLQEILLGAESEKFRAGMSSNFAVIEQQTYLTQAQTTEVAAEAAYRKAQIQLDRAVGEILQKNGITLDPALKK